MYISKSKTKHRPPSPVKLWLRPCLVLTEALLVTLFWTFETFLWNNAFNALRQSFKAQI